ncbi:MAG: substrate-binding domain-containing protein, partial [Phycisphaeraceae bacterium]|nr:substrate-binding domain-containing protein [Phycisphaeraceae bacterium]
STKRDMQEEQRQVELMRQRGVQGIVLYPVSREAGQPEYLANTLVDFPIVVTDLYLPAMKRPHFVFDNFQVGREVTQFLIAQGRCNIAFLKFRDDLLYRSLDDRVAGYRHALTETGLGFDPRYVAAFDGRGPMSPGHCEAVDQLLAFKPRLTALITPNDPYAKSTIAHLRRRGLDVPRDVVVVGFDDLNNELWGERFPTTRPDFVRMGERAAESLLDRIVSGDLSPTGTVLPCPLVIPREMTFAAEGSNPAPTHQQASVTDTVTAR